MNKYSLNNFEITAEMLMVAVETLSIKFNCVVQQFLPDT